MDTIGLSLELYLWEVMSGGSRVKVGVEEGVDEGGLAHTRLSWGMEGDGGVGLSMMGDCGVGWV